MIAADGKTVAVAAEEKNIQVGPRQTDAAGERNSAPVNEVGAVPIDEIRKARGAADAGESNNVLVRNLAFLQHLVIAGEHGEIAAAGTPRRVIGGDGFF